MLITPGERADVVVAPTGTPGGTLALRAMLYNRGYGSAGADALATAEQKIADLETRRRAAWLGAAEGEAAFTRSRNSKSSLCFAAIARGCVRGDQLAHSRAERRGTAEDGLREPREMLGGVGQEGKQVPDLPILGAATLRRLNRVAPRAGFRVLLDAGKKHRVHIRCSRRGDPPST